MKRLYETKISDARWIAYDIPANIGWISYIVGLIIAFVYYDYSVNIAGIIPAVFIVLGISELISERIAKLDRILPAIRLFLGFGALALGCGIGVVVSLTAVILYVKAVYFVMLGGSAVCCAFAVLLFAGYKKQI